TLNSPLPAITNTVSIDGYTEAHGGGVPCLYPSTPDPVYIHSIPNTIDAKDGNNAEERVIIDGSQTTGATGFVLDASHCLLRGLIISGFSVGVSVSALDTSGNPVVGDLIQGNSIGDYYTYPVDLSTGSPLTAPDNVQYVSGVGNAQQGVILNSSNTTVGGSNPQENNIICGNGAQGILVQPGASGNQILGNQIGMAGPSVNGLYVQDGNGAEGVLIESSGSLGNPLSIVYASSNFVGSATGGNVISGNAGAGVRLVGVGAIRNLVQGNYIGVAPRGGYLFGTGDPGNGSDGVLIQDGSQNQVGGTSSSLGNTIDSNHGAGIYITGLATGNVAANNMIGVTAAGTQVLGNWSDGVALYSPSNTIGPGNVISQNLRGIGIYGPGASTPGTASDILVVDNLIGTDGTGQKGFGNAQEGVYIDNSSGNTIQGNSAGSQVISGNQVGVELYGAQSTGNLVEGNFIGSDKTGHLDLGNKNEGVLIEGAVSNTIGGTSPAATNVISGNGWGVTITDSSAIDNVVQGNLIGTGADGLTPLGNEVDGVLITNAANNLIGGLGTGQGNTIAFNVDDGVQVVGPKSNGNGILSNRIFANGGLGIDLVDGGNNLQNAPVLTSLTITSTGVVVQGKLLKSMPDTSYLIQFFLHAPGNSSSDGKLLGATTVLTDEKGTASFSVPLAVNIPAGEGVVATATDPGNNTSEFSAEVINQPAVLVFSMTNYFVNEGAGVAVITVDREGGGGVVTVSYAAGGGTAAPGVDYTPVSGTLTFGLGVTVQNFTVPILDDLSLQSDKTVNLVIASPTGGAKLGMPSSAILTIGPPPPPVPPPAVTGVRLITNRQHIVTGIVVTFSKPLNPTTAVNLLNYNYSVTTAGRNHVFGTRDNLLIPILTAVYNPSKTVTLTLGRGIHPPTPFRFAINQLTDVPGAGIGVSDLAGNLLSGADNGVAGGAYVVILRGNAGGIVPSTREAAVTRQVPRSVAAIDAVLEAGNVGGTWVARAARGRRVRAIDRPR
ncbi:MAG TPA: Calx-beta domain-containing protein, partial [Isosphaeraceae bacterium]|nr:Calx-beta domain-containing protein [Isosphaeraceae bacterium]